MDAQEQFTIEELYRRMSQGKLVGGKCKACGKLHFPPRPLCDNCFSSEFEWVEISPRGKLLTYTIIHVAPTQFQSIAPYAVGIVRLENDLKIPGMIKNVPLDKIEIGMPLIVVFEDCLPTSQWPRWPRYHFEASRE